MITFSWQDFLKFDAIKVNFCIFIFQGPGGSTVYDPLTGSLLAPRWKSILEKVLDPMTLRMYRYPRNDPINTKHDALQGKFLKFLHLYSISFQSGAQPMFRGPKGHLEYSQCAC